MGAVASLKHRNSDLAAIALGAFFIALALLGWRNHAASSTGVFAVNYFVYLATGLILLVASHLGRSAGVIGGLGLIYLLLVAAGLLLPGAAHDDLALDGTDNLLHALFAAMLLVVGIATDAQERIHSAQ